MVHLYVHVRQETPVRRLSNNFQSTALRPDSRIHLGMIINKDLVKDYQRGIRESHAAKRCIHTPSVNGKQ